MPTIHSEKGYRFYFFSYDCREPAHIHVQKGIGGKTAKYWLNPIRLEESGGFSAGALGEIEKIIKEHQAEMLDKWHRHCGGN